MSILQNKIDFAVIVTAKNANPNGDPLNGNMPRTTYSGLGEISDVCIKRKIRNYVETVKEKEEGYRIYIKQGVPLNDSDNEALNYIKENKTEEKDRDIVVRDFMCKNFYDIRTFGAVMTTFVKEKLNCGQVRGPVQLGFARSIDPIVPQEVTITRVAITTAKDAKTKQTEMGKKFIVPYALYRVEGFVSANLARKTTGFSEDDLALLWESIINMFENDHSAARGKMSCRELIVFKHESELGVCPSNKLFDKVKVNLKEGITAPRAYSDYNVVVETSFPKGVECKRMI